MKRILFSHSYFYPLDHKQWKNKTPFPPLATISAAALLRENNFEVALYDTNLRSNVKDLTSCLQKYKPELFVVYDDSFNYLSKMCLTTMREAAFEMIQIAKAFGAFVVVASSDASDHYGRYLEKGADVVLIGEADQTLLELCKKLLEAQNDFDEIPGIAFRKDNVVKLTAKRSVMSDLDVLPQAAWDLVDIESYKKIWKTGKHPFTLNIATTRGCPFKCNWCAKPIYGNRYNVRSPQKVVDEIEFLMNTFQVSYFWMCDDIFGLKPLWVNEFNRYVQERKLKFSYKIQSRVDLLIKDETIRELADSGLKEVWVGAESGSQDILDAMDKGITVAQIAEATQRLKASDVRVAFFLQFGYLGETRDDIALTLKMIKELDPDDIGVSVSYPLPGTGFYDKVKSELGDKQNWDDSDDLAMMFRGTFNPDYYKVLHRYVHRVFRSSQSRHAIRRVRKEPVTLFSSESKKVLLLPYHLILKKYFEQKLLQLDNLR